jgi:hypothetical protein
MHLHCATSATASLKLTVAFGDTLCTSLSAAQVSRLHASPAKRRLYMCTATAGHICTVDTLHCMLMQLGWQQSALKDTFVHHQ